MLWQYIPDPATVAHLITTDLPIERREPGTYMYDALAFRDQWKSRLLGPPPGHRSTDTTCRMSADDRPTCSS